MEVVAHGSDILVDGKPFIARGAAGETQLDVLKSLGANTIRIYGGDPHWVLDVAQRLDLKVIAGLWLSVRVIASTTAIVPPSGHSLNGTPVSFGSTRITLPR